jgi:CHAT domain-containing protein
MNALQCRYLAFVAVFCSPVLIAWQSTPQALQASGIARLERFRDQARRTGYQQSMLAEVQLAAVDLEASYRGFLAASNPAQAAWSLVRLADCERQSGAVISSGQTQTGDPRVDALLRRARGHYAEAVVLARETGSAGYLVKALLGLTLLDDQAHDYGSANARVTEAMRAAGSCPNQDCVLDALGSKVDVELDRGELFSAASHVNGLLALAKRSSDSSQSYYAYFDRASVYRKMTEGCAYNFQKSVDVCFRLFDLAKADMTQARDIAARSGFSYLANVAAGELSQLDVLRNMAQSFNSIATKTSATVRFEAKTPKDVLVTENLTAGQFSPQELEPLKAVLQAAGSSMPGSLGTYIQAEMADMQGRPDMALEGYLSAIRTMEEERQKLGEDSARSSFMDDKISIYERPVLLLLQKKRYAEAFELLDRSRARATADLLATRSLGLSKPVERKLFATVALKRAEITSLQTHFFNATLSSDSSPSDDPETVAKQQAHLAELEADYEQFLRRIAREAPHAQDVAASRPVTLDTLQNALRQDSADLLYYHLIDSAVILMHIGPNSFHVRNIFLPRYELMSKVAALRDSMRKKGVPFREDVSSQLFLYLVQPALGWLSTDRLIIIPQADLQSFPFQAFRDPADGSFLGERFQITYAPSASILLQLNKQPNLAGGTLLAASDPSLPGAPDEVKSLARLYPVRSKVLTDSLIRKADLKQWAGSYDILHLAVHGEFDSEEPLLSSVRLANGAGEDGNLTAAEMFGLPLEKTRIVTLSACETGRVRTTRSNEIQGIQQALLFAGAQSLLVSAWKVDSDATSLWMQTFYREAQTKTPAEAARQAVRTVRRDPRYNHPFYWAPFLLVAR